MGRGESYEILSGGPGLKQKGRGKMGARERADWRPRPPDFVADAPRDQ